MELIYGQINVLSIEFDANEKHLTSAHLPREVNDREGADWKWEQVLEDAAIEKYGLKGSWH